MMNTTSSLSSIDNRIALIRDNIRQLVEQAAAYSGAQDEARTADRIDQQTKTLEDLIKARDQQPARSWSGITGPSYCFVMVNFVFTCPATDT
jgi:hypothetical protein